MNHSLHVATRFRPWEHAFWLGLFHDTPMPKFLLHIWPALDAITRREDEVYQTEYIPRVATSRTATRVKLADLNHNISRCIRPSLGFRYLRAQLYLEDIAP